MDLEETEARTINGCAGEDRQQFIRLTDRQKAVSCSHERAASQVPSSEDVSTQAEEYPLLVAVTWLRLVKTENFM
jgi:hypothetical protein